VAAAGEVEGDALVRLLAGGAAVGVPDLDRLAVLHQRSEALAEAVDQFADTEVQLLVDVRRAVRCRRVLAGVADDARIHLGIRGEAHPALRLVAAAGDPAAVALEGQVPGRTGADAGDQRTGIQAAAGLVDGDG